MARLVNEERYVEAKRLLDRVEGALASDSAVRELRDRIMSTFRVAVTPATAVAEYQEYADTSSTWTALGAGRGDSVTIARGAKRWRVTAAGFDTLYHATIDLDTAVHFSLLKTGTVRRGWR
jgi:hypothetical protein